MSRLSSGTGGFTSAFDVWVDAPVRYLIDRFCKDFNKSAPSRSMHAEETLVEFEWFRDVRDLQNYIEHAVVLCETREVKPTT